ncbi:bifunctional salicylyl-CoA 5-hydroxylase/oxidoreductase [Ruegeria pomeroyi]|uniref:Bifunctional salicylyl-CoA 5-hydroxylase/oxidoreductase n=1 Tax=Ruegeria alba TaxID=2916756 RepID=A0ABS9P036_9RHOB|nr:bifunctional salicylyl-CoA 5-hydroxylase/oxidoreductase [Ruegeria alba]MCE8516694.1 bifunctional salicylyl-CoA 5-hydroxylase/oxidoreductase [Ruegeria pomeroyi]MCE8525559.1 bifunctional salicylyl-CoA 5-hydroxylase/oxidoreductase [Ruegeria pomeroyi]MCE8535461.1 bifunctional salicylyl-CoA 5-hydroxylase/oxidoreductase [Ruegeria pomeroyi]MCG6559853.1 bifunctional salicylyl-CoA 5-hydroxylase/oxidoreductase [Ruegeria alba]
MRIACLGGGPAGLYFAISMKLRDPSHQVTVIERNKGDDTFGWGVVLSDDALENLAANDPKSAETIRSNFAYWDDIAVVHDGVRTVSGGHGFAGIGRKAMLLLLQDRARELGVDLQFQTEARPIAEYQAEYDLVVACDGLNSRVRSDLAAHFKPDIDTRQCKFIWLGTHQKFDDAFTFIFEKTEHGWMWVHAYQFDEDTATVIVECSQETWDAWGFEHMSKEESVATCERIFAAHLGGHKLMSNASHLRGSAVWINFPRVLCEKWHHENVVLMGDAAATAHFSIGSGSRLAFDSAISLATYLHSEPTMESAFERYQEERRLEVLRLQSAARNSLEWFEQVERYLDMDPVQFNYSLLTRSQRISHENLRLRDADWLRSAEQWFQTRAGAAAEPVRAPMFAPFRLRDMELKNRIVVSPMAQYKAVDGCPTDWHLIHYGERAKGGAGLVYTEMTCVSPTGRITPGCPGLYAPEHEAAWKRLTDFVHGETSAKICCQIGHSGRKGSTQLGWETMDAPLKAENWDLISASPIPWSANNATPREMTRADMDAVRDQFVAAAQMAERAGFDMIELHAAHGYLISSFISPMSNSRGDDYGGSLENRMRYPLEVFTAMRAAWPEHKPMSVRISANDWVDEAGVTPEEAVKIAAMFHAAGADIIDVSAGQTSIEAKPVYGRMFQTPFSDRIRNETGIATMAVGNIYEADHANSILMAGRADLICVGRPHLADPYWTLHEAARIGDRHADWPLPYLAGRDQAWRLADRDAETEIRA